MATSQINSKPGPKQIGLRWHRRKGWYRLYEGRAKYFGGGGFAETTNARKRDKSIQARADERRGEFERQYYLGSAIDHADREAGRAQGKSDMIRLYVDNLDLASLSESQIAEIGRRLGIASGVAPVAVPVAPVSSAPVATCQDVGDAYLSHLKDKPQGITESHVRDTDRALRAWYDHTGSDKALRDLTRADFKGYRDQWHTLAAERRAWVAEQKQKSNKPLSSGDMRKGAGVSPSHCNKSLTIVRNAFDNARREAGLDAVGLADLVKLLKNTTDLVTDRAVLTPANLTALLAAGDACPKWSKNQYPWRSMILLGLNCALSNEDMSGIHWGHLDLEAGVLDFARGKNQRIRRIPLWARTVEALQAWRPRCHTDRVFTTRNATALVVDSGASKNDALGREFPKLSKKAGLTFTWNVIRKSSATAAKISGADDATISMLLGDASNAIWRKYGMTVPAAVADATKGIEGYYFG